MLVLLPYLLHDLLGFSVLRCLPHCLHGNLIQVALPLHDQEVCLLPGHLLVLDGPLYCLEVVRVHLILTFLGFFHVVRQLVSTSEERVKVLMPEWLCLQELLVEHVELPKKLGLGTVGLLLGGDQIMLLFELLLH